MGWRLGGPPAISCDVGRATKATHCDHAQEVNEKFFGRSSFHRPRKIGNPHLLSCSTRSESDFSVAFSTRQRTWKVIPPSSSIALHYFPHPSSISHASTSTAFPSPALLLPQGFLMNSAIHPPFHHAFAPHASLESSSGRGRARS